jgi:UDP-N-acetylglucosamine acyltransferase
MPDIHPTAIVERGARIADDVKIGPYSVVGADVVLGSGVIVQSHAVITGRTEIGAGTVIHPFVAIGDAPQDLSYKNEPTGVVIGSRCVIREHATIHRGTAKGRKTTVVGSDCFIMVSAHVAHDCVLGDHVILVNGTALGGHVEIGDHAILSGLSAVQQRTRIGAHAFIGGLSGVFADIIPFGMALGERAQLGGLNIVGLKRRGFDRKTIHALRNAYQDIFDGPGSRPQRIDRVAEKYGDIKPVMTIVDFIRAGGDRPLTTPRD